MGRNNIGGSPDSGNDKSPSAKQIAAATVDEAFEKVDRDAEDAIERAKRNQAAAEILIDGLAEAISEGYDRSGCESFLSEFSQKTRGNITKTNLKEMLDEAAVTATATEGSSNRTTADVVKDASITEIRSTDHNQTTKYRWDIDGYTVVSNGSGQGRYHLSEQELAKEIVAAGGRLPNDTGWDNPQWLRFISDHIRDHAIVQEVVGDQTEVMEKLRDHIEETEAFAPIEALAALEGVFAPRDDGPTNGDSSEIWVPNEVIVSLVDDSPLDSSSELYLELDARGMIPARMNGVREVTSVGGTRSTFWVLSEDFAEPQDFTHNPLDYDDPADYFSTTASDSLSRVSNRNNDDGDDDVDDDTDDDTTTTNEEDDE